MFDKLQSIKDKFQTIEQQLSDPEVVADQNRFRKLNKEYSSLKEIVRAYDEWSRTKKQLDEAHSMQKNENDPEMRALVEEEAGELQERLPKLEQQLKILLLPKDEADSRNAIIEIRAGTGGDEAGLFAADLMRMYQRYAERQGWSCQTLEVSEGSVPGSLKEVSLEVSGHNVYGILKFESGVHRVQRVPETETQGRIHTSAASVAVLPEAEEVDVEIRKEDLLIDTFRSGGKGGQNVNKVETAVRITHVPSGIVVACQEERSQLQNRERAMKMLMAQLYQRRREEEEAKKREIEGKKKKIEWGSQIRSYVLDDRRIKDHRTNYERFDVENVLDGDIDDYIQRYLSEFGD